MNIYTVLGAALTSREIRRLLFDDPQLAADKLGIVLSNSEERSLRDITRKGDRNVQQQFRMLAQIVCPQRPCMFAPISVADADSQEAPDSKTDYDPDVTESASATNAAD
jgi:hypothetical protein